MQTARDYLTALYLDWFNNYASLATFAEHNGITEAQAAEIIKTAREIATTQHPEA